MKFLLSSLIVMLIGATAFAAPKPCPYPTPALAYQAAELAVIGKVVGKGANGTDQRFIVDRVVKGKAAKEILLHGQQAVNTEGNGFALPENEPVLLMLTEGPDGSYQASVGFNSACPVYYPVRSGAIILSKPDSDAKLMVPESVIGSVLEKP